MASVAARALTRRRAWSSKFAVAARSHASLAPPPLPSPRLTRPPTHPACPSSATPTTPLRTAHPARPSSATPTTPLRTAHAARRWLTTAAAAMASPPSTRPLGRLTPETSTLFVCDVQDRFRDLIWRFPAVVDTTARLVKGAAALGIPVFVTEQYPKALGNTVAEVAAHFAACPQPPPVIAKTDFSMMPAYETWVAGSGGGSARRRHHIIIVGIEAHVCVLQTALDALAAGHEVHLAVDGISSQRAEPDRSTGLARALAAGAHAATSEQLLFQLCGGAGHPAFKAVSGLVKEARAAPGLPGVGGGEARL